MTTADEQISPPPWVRPSTGELLTRALRLRCPRCGTGRLFRKGYSMHQQCTDCQLNFDRAPGYYLGATYINYGITSVLLIILYLTLHNGLNFSNQDLALPLMLVCVLVPLALFRHARALWLALDCQFDKSVLNDGTEDAVP